MSLLFKSFMTIFKFNIGNFDMYFLDRSEKTLPNPNFLHILFTISNTYLIMIMLNLMIAIMGDIFTRVQGEADSTFMFELGDLIRNLESYIPKNIIRKNSKQIFPRHLFVL